MFRPLTAILRPTFDIDCLFNCVTGAGVAEQLFQKIRSFIVMPKMVMRIDDGTVRIDNLCPNKIKSRLPRA